MSKLFPDPMTDRGKDFWEFDNMVTEYEWEQQHRRSKKQKKQEPNSKWIYALLIVFIAMILSAFWLPPLSLVLGITLIIIALNH